MEGSMFLWCSKRLPHYNKVYHFLMEILAIVREGSRELLNSHFSMTMIQSNLLIVLFTLTNPT